MRRIGVLAAAIPSLALAGCGGGGGEAGATPAPGARVVSVVTDDDVAVIGSSNLDIRSLSLHLELSVLVHGAKFTAAMRAVEDDYRSKSRQVALEEWLRRPTRERIFDNLMRLTSSLQ